MVALTFRWRSNLFASFSNFSVFPTSDSSAFTTSSTFELGIHPARTSLRTLSTLAFRFRKSSSSILLKRCRSSRCAFTHLLVCSSSCDSTSFPCNTSMRFRLATTASSNSRTSAMRACSVCTSLCVDDRCRTRVVACRFSVLRRFSTLACHAFSFSPSALASTSATSEHATSSSKCAVSASASRFFCSKMARDSSSAACASGRASFSSFFRSSLARSRMYLALDLSLRTASLLATWAVMSSTFPSHALATWLSVSSISFVFTRVEFSSVVITSNRFRFSSVALAPHPCKQSAGLTSDTCLRACVAAITAGTPWYKSPCTLSVEGSQVSIARRLDRRTSGIPATNTAS
mmetsp:Transcript_54155/g.107532  ORF Transcript_54155/g.107532 Transcript_54155/m.107532 type:complete len:347 (-) Transcript_54155:74-1114(-)